MGMNKGRWYWLLVVPFVATLVPPFYAHRDPQLFGFPFFYWYQFVWIAIAAFIVWVVYAVTREAEHD
jgi:hypothetical protein